ncbi:hypothetical protein [Streptococcus suis]|uniref:hypothetical protein n=1 Tax=Streptococcus suis TaxID=1307 RepID=UPI0014324663|nr:hypothetical protein [Streptococcus suis]NJW41949.1 hypothetical protein [Streptococcus suis]
MDLNDYYTDIDPDFSFRELRRKIERYRIVMQARVLLDKRDTIKRTGKTDIQKIASETKQTIQTLRGRLETSIKGSVRTGIEEAVDKHSSLYDTITQS